MIVSDRLLMKHMLAYRPHWPWMAMRGSSACLKWGFRDLGNLDKVLKIVPGRSVVVQAGGNLGLFPKRLAEEFRRVYTFEPDPSLYGRLRRNAPEANITALPYALGESREGVALSRVRRDGTGKPEHEGLTHVCGPGDIKQILLDDLDLQACDLIYLDIEGYEFKALRGAVRTIERLKPVLAIEVNRNATFVGVDPDDLRAWIFALGYSFHTKFNSDEVFIPC